MLAYVSWGIASLAVLVQLYSEMIRESQGPHPLGLEEMVPLLQNYQNLREGFDARSSEQDLISYCVKIPTN